jgi:hypothetical protein
MRARVAIALAAIAAVAVWMRRPDSTPSAPPTASPPRMATAVAHLDPLPALAPVAGSIAGSPTAAMADVPEIRGHVIRRHTHTAVAGVVVVARGAMSSGGLDRVTGTTDGDGRFVLPASSSHYDLAVESVGWFGGASIDVGTTRSIDDVVIEATAGVAIVGRVEGGCTVVLRSERASMRASGNGAVRFAAVPPGDYDVGISCGPRSSEAVVHVADRELDVDWRIDPGLAISGRVVDAAGAPVPHAVVAFEAHDLVVDTHAGDDGRFEITGLVDGTYAVTVVSDDRRTLSAQLDVQAGTREVSLVTTATGAVHGRAERATDAMTAYATGDDGIVAATSIHADGTFAFDDLAPGPQTIAICDPSAGEVGVSTSIVEAGRTADIHVTAHPSVVVPAGESPCELSAGEVAIATPP